MNNLYIEDFKEIACEMYAGISVGCEDISFVGKYEDCVCLIKDLLCLEDVCLHQVEIEPEDWDGYDKEYLVTLDNELNIWCEKAYRENVGYFLIESECILIADDCNVEIYDHLESDDIWKVSYSFMKKDCPEEECCGECYCFDGCASEDKEVESETTEITESSSEYHNVSRNKDGKVTGFTKSWTTEKNGITGYSSFSYMGNDESAVRKLAKDFGIKID